MTGIPATTGELVDAVTFNTLARGYLRKTTAKAVSGTTTATDLLNGEFTLPAGAMSTDKIVRLTAWGDFKQNTGSARDFPTFELLLGATTLIVTSGSGAGSVAASVSNRYGWRIQCEIQNLGSASSQQSYLFGQLSFKAIATSGNLSSVFDTGNGVIMTDMESGAWGSTNLSGGNTSSVDTSASLALLLNVVNANNGANYETKLLGALVEII